MPPVIVVSVLVFVIVPTVTVLPIVTALVDPVVMVGVKLALLPSTHWIRGLLPPVALLHSVVEMSHVPLPA